MAVFQCCVWLIAEMRSSRAVFDLNYRQYGVNRYLWLYKFPKKLGNVPCSVRILTLKYAVCGALV